MQCSPSTHLRHFLSDLHNSVTIMKLAQATLLIGSWKEWYCQWVGIIITNKVWVCQSVIQIVSLVHSYNHNYDICIEDQYCCISSHQSFDYLYFVSTSWEFLIFISFLVMIMFFLVLFHYSVSHRETDLGCLLFLSWPEQIATWLVSFLQSDCPKKTIVKCLSGNYAFALRK